jgi:CRISPR/Cas system-associated endonuclease Cas1
MLFIANPQVSISTRLLSDLGKNNSIIIIVDEKYLPSIQCIPISGNYRSYEMFNYQIK